MTVQFGGLDTIIRYRTQPEFPCRLLWFGTWKNGTMDYAPGWVRQDTRRLPRMLDEGRIPVRVLTPLSDANREADAKAFASRLRHLKQIDGHNHTGKLDLWKAMTPDLDTVAPDDYVLDYVNY